MTFTLTPYQSTASDACVNQLRYAADDFINRDAKRTAVGLTAPTGAGKTVIATSVLERLLFGDDTTPGNPNLAILWVTDDPALNRQTLEKMLTASARFADGDFVEIDARFDAKRLHRGRIHFAHAQLLGKGTTSMQASNSRENGLWEIVANTVDTYGSDFLLVIDEAHRGTEGKKDATIMERLCHGGTADHFSGRTHPAAPVIFGISATPERFKAAMERAGRSLETYEVPVADVRESGLLKDRIVVRHPGENQPSEATLLARAVAALKASDTAWRAHAETTGTAPVEPLLVIQVPPGISDADLASITSTLETEWPALTGDAVRHSFQSHTVLNLPGDRDVRYIAPDRIAADTRVRAVLFKNALTTGWDCPRAEVMLSLRAAKDYTSIAQLIGRMVRTPLAERIETDEVLNDVTLYLPHYSKDQVAKVVAALGADTGGDTEVVLEPIDCVKRTDVPDAVWDLLAALPSAARVKKPYASETHRLIALGSLLRGHGLLRTAASQVRARLVGAIKTEASVHAVELKDLVEDVQTLDEAETVWDNRRGEFIESDAAPVQVATRVLDIDRQYATAVRLMPDATAKWYWNALQDDDVDLDPYDAKAQVAALVKTSEMATIFKETVEKAARDQVVAWRSQYANQVQMLPQQARLEFEGAWSPRTGTLTVDVEVAGTVSAPTEKVTGTGDNATTEVLPVYGQHLYVAAATGEPYGQTKVEPGMFPAAFTSWEVDVVTRETAYPTLVGWYRNPARSKHGLAIAYEMGGETGLLYPDFLTFHEVDARIVVDVVDPHAHHTADTGPKWAGLARWATDLRLNHREVALRRVVAVIKIGTELLALDLTQDGIAERLDACSTKPDIEALFAEVGGTY